MPWQNQSGGGGPWGGGGGGQGPWGGSGGGGGNPPDLDEVLRKSQDKLKRIFPGGGSGKILTLIVLLVVGVWLLTGFYRVQPDEQGVELIFGKALPVPKGPGLHYNYPAPIGQAITPKVTKSNRVDVGYRSTSDRRGRVGADQDVPQESLMLTQDENIVDMDFAVLWKIKNAKNYLFNIRDPELTVKAVAESSMREVVGQTSFDDAVTIGREQMQARTKELMQKILDTYNAGIEIENVQLEQSDPPKQVIDAFNDVQRARQDQERLRNEAEAYANSIVPQARGLAEQKIKQAEAYREQQIQEATGEAKRFEDVYKSYQAAPEVTKRRMYLEVIGQVYGDAQKVIIDQKAGSGPGVVPYLPLPEVQKRARENAEPETDSDTTENAPDGASRTQ
ncbi:MAG TPA: FtsH protease activity modulator HflK [Rhodospirillaceae bacterium]|nr:FtsH protease activity modulator HflK [Rhodospirillaceae bacterium]HAT35811.1 FtsH protease activity modulator HflK [Rhodospirillaceae bacterium]